MATRGDSAPRARLFAAGSPADTAGRRGALSGLARAPRRAERVRAFRCPKFHPRQSRHNNCRSAAATTAAPPIDSDYVS